MGAEIGLTPAGDDHAIRTAQCSNVRRVTGERQGLPLPYGMPVRLGVLGCGSIARAAHLRSLARAAGANVVAIADADPANLAAARALAPGARATAEYQTVLEMPDVDAVIVALPPALHADATLAALAHGKHVYVEKPLATNVADAERVVAAWEQSGLTAMMGFNYRYNPIAEQARARVASGAVGKPIAARTVFSTARRDLPAWKQQRASGGGVLLDLAVHHIDLIRFLLGAEVTQVSADVHTTASDQDTAFLQMRLTNDVTVQSMCSLSAVEEDRIEIYGSTGKLTIDRYRSLRVEESLASTGGALGTAVARLMKELRAAPYALEKRRAPLHDPSFPAAMNAFVRAVERRAVATPTLSDGLRALAVIEAAERSAGSGRAITLGRSSGAATPSHSTIDAAGA
jgi:predicted dehydrogenase